jgi:hypothetical protein
LLFRRRLKAQRIGQGQTRAERTNLQEIPAVNAIAEPLRSPEDLEHERTPRPREEERGGSRDLAVCGAASRKAVVEPDYPVNAGAFGQVSGVCARVGGESIAKSVEPCRFHHSKLAQENRDFTAEDAEFAEKQEEDSPRRTLWTRRKIIDEEVHCGERRVRGESQKSVNLLFDGIRFGSRSLGELVTHPICFPSGVFLGVLGVQPGEWQFAKT